MKRRIVPLLAAAVAGLFLGAVPVSGAGLPEGGITCGVGEAPQAPAILLDASAARRRSPRLGSFNIVLQTSPTLAANTALVAAFERAIAQWEAVFSDPITITISADLRDLGSTGPGASTGNVRLVMPYSAMREYLVEDAAGESDDGIVASLPAPGSLSTEVPLPYTVTGNVQGSKAAFKAMGVGGLDDPGVGGPVDGQILINTQYVAKYDYDRSDGIGAGLVDVEGMLAHEIGHLLGFTSEVDTVDALAFAGAPAQQVTMTGIDLFRFWNDAAGDDPSTAADFSTYTRSLTYASDDITDDITSEWRMSTGARNGDGRQASHWKDDALTGTTIGALDPTLTTGQIWNVGYPDIRALDLIGYDYEPCGNGTVDTGETCDDGNRTDGDCCDSDCQADASGTACASDGNSCTNDACNGTGSCVHYQAPNFTPCDDGLFCLSGEYCVFGSCLTIGIPTCTGECNNTCNEATDTCATPAGTACSSDANPCTNDTCNGSGSCAHTPNTSPCADDGSECTDDVCSGGACTHPANTGDACTDDGNPCTDDLCDLGGACVHPANTAPCASDGNLCTGDVCSGGSCTHPANTSPCDDGAYCNGADTCSGGTCSQHEGSPCDDGSVCGGTCDELTDTCDAPSGTPCDDGVFCNGDDQCSGGSCSLHDGDPCAGGAECADTCDEGADSCLSPAGTPCPGDGDPCTDDVCSGGACTHPANTAPCDDGAYCNGADTCSGGTCSQHEGSPCDDGSVCGGTCDELTDTCDAPSGTPCDDGVFCNGDDKCSGGSCSLHNGDPCVGGAECTDTCDEGAGACVTPAGTACTDDGDACTDDECDGAGACGHDLNPGLPGCTICPDEPQEDCLTGTKAVVSITKSADPADDKLSWKWQMGEATTMPDFGTPSVDTAYRLCFYSVDVGVPQLLAQGLLAAGPAWVESPGRGWRYKDKTGASAGITQLKAKAGVDGKSQVSLKGKGASLELPAPVGGGEYFRGTSVIVQLGNSVGRCWATAFRPMDMTLNTPEEAKVTDKLALCGDGLRDSGETCDWTDDAACPGRCDMGFCICLP